MLISTRKMKVVLKLARHSMLLFVLRWRAFMHEEKARELERELKHLGLLEARLWLTVQVQAGFAPGYLPADFELD